MLEEIGTEPAALIIEEVVETTCREGLHHPKFDFISDLEISDPTMKSAGCASATPCCRRLTRNS